MKNFNGRRYSVWIFICIFGYVVTDGKALICNRHEREHSRTLDDKQRTTGQSNIEAVPYGYNIIGHSNHKDGQNKEYQSHINSFNTKDDKYNYNTNSEEVIPKLNDITTIYLAGYDDQIINLMNDIQKQGTGCEVLVYFYLITNNDFQNIGNFYTDKNILRDSIARYNHYFCVGHNSNDCSCLSNVKFNNKQIVQINPEIKNEELNKKDHTGKISGQEFNIKAGANKIRNMYDTTSELKVNYPEKQSTGSYEFILPGEKDVKLKDVFIDVLHPKPSEVLPENKMVQSLDNVNNDVEHIVEIANNIVSGNNNASSLPKLNQQNILYDLQEIPNTSINFDPVTISTTTSNLNNNLDYINEIMDQRHPLAYDIPNININLPDTETSSVLQLKPDTYEEQVNIPVISNHKVQLLDSSIDIKPDVQKIPNLEPQNMISQETTTLPINVVPIDQINEPKISNDKYIIYSQNIPEPIFRNTDSVNQALGSGSDIPLTLTAGQINGAIEINPKLQYTNEKEELVSNKLNNENILINPIQSNTSIELNGVIPKIALETKAIDRQILSGNSNFMTIDSNPNQNQKIDDVVVFSSSTPTSRNLGIEQGNLIQDTNTAQVNKDIELTLTVESGTIKNEGNDVPSYVNYINSHVHEVNSPLVGNEEEKNNAPKFPANQNFNAQSPYYSNIDSLVNSNHYNIPTVSTNRKEVRQSYVHNHNNYGSHVKTPHNYINYQLIPNKLQLHHHHHNRWNFLQNGDVIKQSQSRFQSLDQPHTFEVREQLPYHFSQPFPGVIDGHYDLQGYKQHNHGLTKPNINQNENIYAPDPEKYMPNPNILKPLLSNYKNAVKYLKPVTNTKGESILDLSQINQDDKYNQRNPQQVTTTILDPCTYKNILTLEQHGSPTGKTSSTLADPRESTHKTDTLFVDFKANSQPYNFGGFVPTYDHFHLPASILSKFNMNASPINPYYNTYISNLSQIGKKLTSLTSEIDSSNKDQYDISNFQKPTFPMFTIDNDVPRTEQSRTLTINDKENNMLQKDSLVESIIKYINNIPQIPEYIGQSSIRNKLELSTSPLLYQPYLNQKPLVTNNNFRIPSHSHYLLPSKEIKAFLQPQKISYIGPYQYSNIAHKTQPLAHNVTVTGLPNNDNSIPMILNNALLPNVSSTVLNPCHKKVESPLSKFIYPTVTGSFYHPSSSSTVTPNTAYYTFASKPITPLKDTTIVSHAYLSLWMNSILSCSTPGLIEQKPYATEAQYVPKSKYISHLLPLKGESSTTNTQSSTADSQNSFNLETFTSKALTNKNSYEPSSCYSQNITPTKPFKASSDYVTLPLTTTSFIPHLRTSNIPFCKASPQNVVSYVNKFPSDSSSAPELSDVMPSMKIQGTKSFTDTVNYPYYSHVSPVNADLSYLTQSPNTKPISTNILRSHNSEFLPTISSIVKPRSFKSNLDTKHIHSPYYNLPSFAKPNTLSDQEFQNYLTSIQNFENLSPNLVSSTNGKMPFSHQTRDLKHLVFSPNYSLAPRLTYGIKDPWKLLNYDILPKIQSRCKNVSPRVDKAIVLPVPGNAESVPLANSEIPSSPMQYLNPCNLNSFTKHNPHYSVQPCQYSENFANLIPCNTISPNLYTPGPSQNKVTWQPPSSCKESNHQINGINTNFASIYQIPAVKPGFWSKEFPFRNAVYDLPTKIPKCGQPSQVTYLEIKPFNKLANIDPLNEVTKLDLQPTIPTMFINGLQGQAIPIKNQLTQIKPLSNLNVLPSLFLGSEKPKSAPFHTFIPSLSAYLQNEVSNFIPASLNNMANPFATSITVIPTPGFDTSSSSFELSPLPENKLLPNTVNKIPLTQGTPLDLEVSSKTNFVTHASKMPLKSSSLAYQTYPSASINDYININEPNLSFYNLQISQPVVSTLLNPKTSNLSPKTTTIWANFRKNRKFTPFISSDPIYVSSHSEPRQSIHGLPVSSLSMKVPYQSALDYSSGSALSLPSPSICSTSGPLLGKTLAPFIHKSDLTPDANTWSTPSTAYYASSIPHTHIPTLAEKILDEAQLKSNNKYTRNKTLEKAYDGNIEQSNVKIINQMNNDIQDYIEISDVKNNVLNEKLIEIPLNKYIGVIQYEPTCKVSYLKTDNPDIYLKVWPTAVKIVKPKVVLEIGKLEALNFCPIVKDKNISYTNDEIQKLVEVFVKKYYGEPIIVTSSHKPHFVPDNVNESFIKNGKVYIVWANVCDCGCNRIGCHCINSNANLG